jgi:hypothetical protein
MKILLATVTGTAAAEMVFAGWCSEECMEKIGEIVSPTGIGCVGTWHEALGLEQDPRAATLRR